MSTSSHAARDQSIVIQSKPESEPEKPIERPAAPKHTDSESPGESTFQQAAAMLSTNTEEEEEETRALKALSERASSAAQVRVSGPGVFGGRLGVQGRVGPAMKRNLPNVPPPPGYECRRCGKPGHYIQHCPAGQEPQGPEKKAAEAAAPIAKVWARSRSRRSENSDYI
jgi:hypothetical protein